jgi:hypothetical protein
VLPPVGEHGDGAQDRCADHFPDAANAKGNGVEVHVDDVEVSQRTLPPRLRAVLQLGDHARPHSSRVARP